MGNKDLAEKNLLQYKDVFSDIVNVNLFVCRHYISANELSREPGELITKSSSDNKLKQLQMDVPMKCNKKYNTRFFVCLENQSDINNIMPVRDMGYQHAKYMEQVRTIKEANRQQQAYPSPITKGIHDTQKLDPVITLVLNYSQKEWKKPKQLQDVLNIPKDIKNMLLKHIPSYAIDVINLANQSESTMQMYHSDFKYIVRYLSCKNDKEKLESFFRTTDFELDHPEAFLDWLAAVANDERYIKAKQLIDKQNEKGGHINMCVLLDMYEERGEKRGIAIGEERGITIGEERGEARGIYEINTLNLHLLDDNRLEDMQRAMVDTDYQKELMKEYGIGV